MSKIRIWLAVTATALALTLPAWAAWPEECHQGVSMCFGVNWQTATVEDVAGMDVNARSKAAHPFRGSWHDAERGGTPLHWAARYNKNPAVLDTLLKLGAEVNAWDVEGETPLHWAAEYSDNPAVIGVLVKAGADVNAQSKDEDPMFNQLFLIETTDFRDGWTPLHRAAWWNENPAVIEALVQAGAEVNARNDFGHTPLHLAARNGKNPAVVAVLVAYGASLEDKNTAGKTPLDVAQQANNAEMIAYLSNPAQVKKDTENYRHGSAKE